MKYTLTLPDVHFIVRVVKTLENVVVGQTRPSIHDCHEVVYLVRGAYHVEVAGQDWPGVPGDVFCYPAGTPHLGHMPLDHSNTHLVLQWRPAEEEPWPAAPFRVHDADGRIAALLCWLERATPAPTPPAVHRRAAVAYVLLQELRALAEEGTFHRGDTLARARHILDTRFDLPDMSLRYLADMVDRTPSYLCRLFHQRLGLSPMAYLRRRRLEAALQAIVHTPTPVGAIAAQFGFCSTAHLSNHVRAATGRTPTDLRQAAPLRATMLPPPPGPPPSTDRT